MILNIADGAAVDEIVDWSKLTSPFDEALDIVGTADVARREDSASAQGTNFRRRFLGIGRTGGVTEGDIGAFAREPKRDGAPDATRPACDKSDTLMEVVVHEQIVLASGLR